MLRKSPLNRSLRITILFAAILALLQSSAVYSQSVRSTLATQAALVTEFDVNGLKVIYKRRLNSETVAAGLFIRGGAKLLTAQNAGIEDLMLNTATEGSRSFPRSMLRRELAGTGGSISSGTNYDFSVLAMASTIKTFDRMWEMFADIAVNPAFTQEDVRLTKEKLITALRDDEDDPDGYLQVLVNRTINARSSYQYDPNGTIENIGRLTPQDLRVYHQQVMQNSRLLLVIVGDLDTATLKQKVTATFTKLPRGNYVDAPAAGFDFSKPTLDITPRELPTNYVQGVFDAPAISSPDFYPMRVATTVLRDRVFEEVRVKRNLSYAPSADMGSLRLNTGNIYVTSVEPNRAISVMLDEIRKMKQDPVPERDISGVAGQFLTTYFLGQETNASQAAELARYELLGGGWRNAFDFLDRIQKVTPADVQRVSQKYMKNLRFIVLGNPASIDRSIFLKQ